MAHQNMEHWLSDQVTRHRKKPVATSKTLFTETAAFYVTDTTGAAIKPQHSY